MHTMRNVQSIDTTPTSTPSRFVRAITNPDQMISTLLPKVREPTPNSKRLEDFKLARSLGGMGLDYGLGEPDKLNALPPADSPLFCVDLDEAIEDKLPKGYHMRSLQRGDYDRGCMQLKEFGSITRTAWTERCEYLRSRADVYTILVITDAKEQVVAMGTLLLEWKLTSATSLVGHIDDLIVAKDQGGKDLSFRLLDQLDRLANKSGCIRTVLGTQSMNEAFYNQKGFRHTGIEMTHVYVLSNERIGAHV